MNESNPRTPVTKKTSVCVGQGAGAILDDPAILGLALRPLVQTFSPRIRIGADNHDRIHLVAEVTGNRAHLFVELGRVIAILRSAADPSTLFPGEDRVRGSLQPAVHLVSQRAFPREPFLGLGAGTIDVVYISRDHAKPVVRKRERWFDADDRTPEQPSQADGLSPEEQLFFDQLARDYSAAR